MFKTYLKESFPETQNKAKGSHENQKQSSASTSKENPVLVNDNSFDESCAFATEDPQDSERASVRTASVAPVQTSESGEENISEFHLNSTFEEDNATTQQQGEDDALEKDCNDEVQPQDTQGNEVIVDKGKGKGPLAPSTDEDSESEKDDGDSEEAESNQEHSSELPANAPIGRPRGRPRGATNKANNSIVDMVDGGKGKGPFAPSTDEDSESEKHDEDSEEAENTKDQSSEPPTKAAIGRPRGRPKGATNKANNVFVEIDLSKAHPCRSSRHSNAVAGPSNLGKRKTSEEEDLSSGKSKKKKDNAKSVAGKSVIRRILRDQQAKQGGRI